MKSLILLASFLALFTFKAQAQQLIEIKDAKRYVGRRVTIIGYVSGVKVFNPSLVRVTISSNDLRQNVYVIQRGKGAALHFRLLHRKQAGSEGVITMKGGQPYIYTTTKNLMGLLEVSDPGLNCIEGAAIETFLDDTLQREN